MTSAANYRVAHAAANAELGNFAEKNWDPPRRDKMQSAAAKQLNAACAQNRVCKIQKSSGLALYCISLTGRTRHYSPTYQLRRPNFESSINESPSVPCGQIRLPNPVDPSRSRRSCQKSEEAVTRGTSGKLVTLEITCRLPRNPPFHSSRKNVRDSGPQPSSLSPRPFPPQFLVLYKLNDHNLSVFCNPLLNLKLNADTVLMRTLLRGGFDRPTAVIRHFVARSKMPCHPAKTLR
jgi:hypothetical protein